MLEFWLVFHGIKVTEIQMGVLARTEHCHKYDCMGFT